MHHQKSKERHSGHISYINSLEPGEHGPYSLGAAQLPEQERSPPTPGQKRSARPMVTLPSAQAGLEKSLQAQTSQTQQKPTGGPFLESRTLLLHLKPKNAFNLV